MSLISTVYSLQANSKILSNIEYKISLVQNEQMDLTQRTNLAQGNKQMEEQLHKMSVQLERDLKKLNMEYDSYKHRVESDEKMQKEAIKRAFSSTI